MVKNSTSGRDASTYGFYAIFGLVTYFIWCDLNFFGEIAAEKPEVLGANKSALITKYTVKLRMLCHFDHYINLPFCEWANEYFEIWNISWITPNIVTLFHFCLAITCGRLFGSSVLFIRRVGVLLFQVRNMLDVMDGVIYRAQRKNSKALVSGWGSWGFWVDGMADTIGSLFIMFGTLYRFNKNRPWDPNTLSKMEKYKASEVESASKLLSSDDSCLEDIEEVHGLKRHTGTYVNVTTISLAISVGLRGALWDHFVHSYHSLLSVRRPDISPEKQLAALNYGSTWFCMWLWKFHSADALLFSILIAIFFNKLWRWMRFWLYATIPNLVIIVLICHFHLMELRSLLGVRH